MTVLDSVIFFTGEEYKGHPGGDGTPIQEAMT